MKLTKDDLKQICEKRGITFIPHHDCPICGEYVGWYLFHRWPPYEVAFSSACGCSSFPHAEEDSWESILEWITDKNGELRETYKYLQKDETD